MHFRGWDITSRATTEKNKEPFSELVEQRGVRSRQSIPKNTSNMGESGRDEQQRYLLEWLCHQEPASNITPEDYRQETAKVSFLTGRRSEAVTLHGQKWYLERTTRFGNDVMELCCDNNSLRNTGAAISVQFVLEGGRSNCLVKTPFGTTNWVKNDGAMEALWFYRNRFRCLKFSLRCGKGKPLKVGHQMSKVNIMVLTFK